MKRLLSLIALVALGAFGPAQGGDNLPTAENLAALGQQVEREGKPMVVFFYQDECHYCDAVWKEYLKPINRDPAYNERIILRKIDTRGDGAIKNFGGEEVRQQGFAHRQEHTFTPTIAFYGPDGQRLTSSLIGFKGGRDYYGHYLEEGIEEAEAALREGL
ncbi:thioredoxin family protein [Thiohalorhabdus sp.]|uniref:thioredoxin family protein n=1 Tax=Thiohalorhabdus sp. TaxID=3094134 RepID=UPI002FC3561C